MIAERQDIDYGSKEYKDHIAERLRSVDITSYALDNVDERLLRYVQGCIDNPDGHNVYELLSVLKFFRLMRTYTFRVSKVKKFVKLYESLKFSGMDGRRCYKLTPVQYFQFANILGFYKWEFVGFADPGTPDKEGKKKKIRDGKKYELRRLIREVILFIPRKFSKTTSTASLAVNELLNGDANAQAYTAGNSFRQASICYGEISKIVRQLDPSRKYFKPLRETISWRQPNKYGKESWIECLSGGADTKDGLNASLVIYDEYGSATYVKDHSVGAELLQVLTSSMGARREPLTILITTAGRDPNTPFMTELENAKRVLREEYTADRQFAHLFMPDAWEMGRDSLGDPALWRKVNPHIGITIQESWYEEKWEKATRDAEAMQEFCAKLMNIYPEVGEKAWITQMFARTLQVDFKLNETKGRPTCMVGLDLSISDDLSVVVYNIYSKSLRKFYIWLDAYIPEQTLQEHPNRELYRIWVQYGWMKVCKGAVIDDRMIVNDILANSKYVSIQQIGYDAFKSQEIVNSLAAALSAIGNDPKKILRAVPQTYGAFTSPVETFEYAAKSDPPKVALSMSPILPYAFGNAYLDVDKMENKKPLKKKENLKIDPVIGTLETFWLYNNWERTE